MNLNELSKECHKAAVKKGFYNDYHQHYNKSIQSVFFAQRIALIHSELSEALEADRKNYYTTSDDLAWALSTNDESHLMQEHFPEKIKNTVEDELADTLIRIFDLCGFLNGGNMASKANHLTTPRSTNLAWLLCYIAG